MEARRFEEGNRVSSWAIFEGEVARAYVPRTDDPAADARRARLFAMAEEMEAILVRFVEKCESGLASSKETYGACKDVLARLDGDAETGGKD